MKVLFIGYVWPEPRSSAAGLRSMTLLRTFREAGWETHFATSTRENEHSERLRAQGIPTHRVAPNDPAFDAWIAGLAPDFVVFDRFMIEEQYGWRIQEHSPRSVRVLDTVDLHFVRRARQEMARQGMDPAPVAASRSGLASADALREIAAIYRSDLTLLISDFELGLLTDPEGEFRVPARLLQELGFGYDPPPPPAPDEARAGFAVIGNFRHEPNADGVRWLKREIWPLIRRELPRARVRVYGAYPSREMMDLSDPARGFVVEGPAPDQYATLGAALVNLAPLRFGAGLKGKISDGWWCGTPCITTSIGAEGMRAADGSFGGAIADDPAAFAREACRLHEDAGARATATAAGYAILRGKFDHGRGSARLIQALLELQAGLDDARRANFTGRMLGHHLHQSTKYFSRWIELKESRSGSPLPSLP